MSIETLAEGAPGGERRGTPGQRQPDARLAQIDWQPEHPGPATIRVTSEMLLHNFFSTKEMVSPRFVRYSAHVRPCFRVRMDCIRMLENADCP